MTYPWETASTSHLLYRMTDAEVVAAMLEALKTPRSGHYIDSMRTATLHRRIALSPEDNMRILGAMYVAIRRQATAHKPPIFC